MNEDILFHTPGLGTVITLIALALMATILIIHLAV